VQQVGRHAKGNNLILLVVLLEFKRVVALIAVKYKQLVYTKSALLCMLIKVL
jgi:hypothetical protein